MPSRGTEPQSQAPRVVTEHRFLDEAGDTTFFGKGRVVTIGQPGVSRAFSIGMVKFNGPLGEARAAVEALQSEVLQDAYLNCIPSVAKKAAAGGFFFHATDDPPEVRERMMRFIHGLDCSLEMVVARKIPALFARKHNGRESEFYADLLSHLLKNKFRLDRRLVLNISERGASTRNANLQTALDKALERFGRVGDRSAVSSRVVFNVQNPRTEPLLCIPDYLCWAVQRVFERGETRHYDFLRDKIAVVVDIYDQANYEGSRNYYRRGTPLTAQNKLGPPPP